MRVAFMDAQLRYESGIHGGWTGFLTRALVVVQRHNIETVVALILAVCGGVYGVQRSVRECGDTRVCGSGGLLF